LPQGHRRRNAGVARAPQGTQGHVARRAVASALDGGPEIFSRYSMSELFSLKGRTALVTGGSRGIGRMIAAGFLAQGAKVYISSRKADACEATARELASIGTCIPLAADVSTVEGARGLAAAYAAREESLDILVNNA